MCCFAVGNWARHPFYDQFLAPIGLRWQFSILVRLKHGAADDQHTRTKCAGSPALDATSCPLERMD
jgi:hypothetical protein